MHRHARSFLRRKDGTAAVEFSLVLPAFALVITAMVDVGSGVYMKSRLSTSVSAASSYSLMNAAKVNPADVGGLANLLSQVTAGSATTGVVDINNAIRITRQPGSGTTTSGGQTTTNIASNANACWCPTVSAGAVSWGGSVSCGSSCSGGGTAGKFVWVELRNTFTPIVSAYGVVGNSIAATAMVRVQ
ncbi:MAG: pilus assembly protein [Beijerinckiaceae bacterium]|nr:pilus assembly protein [Beijerinckiaceae bacterium]